MGGREDPDVEVRLLGEPEVVVGGRTVVLRPGKQQALLVALALTPGTPVSSDKLVDALWDDAPPASAAMTLRGLVARLRQVLGGEGVLGRRGTGYVLDVPADRVDVVRFAALTAEGRAALDAGDPAWALDHFDAGLSLWRGPALGAVADLPFAVATVQGLSESRLDAAEDAAAAEVALDRASAAVARLEPHVTANPLRERACGLLMRALVRLGRQADALAAYDRLRAQLADELGIDPTAELQELHRAILQQRPVQIPTDGGPTEVAGTVALLFTDIAASSRHWEGDADAMSAALAEHDRLLGRACEAWGGRVFSHRRLRGAEREQRGTSSLAPEPIEPVDLWEHTGDGLCAAFATAGAALGAAAAGQLALARAQGPCASLRVRMGVHAGTVERRAGNYFGPTLNRTARLMSLASGGQVLCSATAAGLAADRLGEGLGLRDLGEVDLPDLARPERAYQLTHPQLPTDFPALTASRGPRTNLPHPLTPFVGREAELAAVVRAVRGSRLVTLAGPGGSGKTRLAVQAARAVLHEHADGVWFVDLTPLRDPGLVPGQVAAAVGLDALALADGGRPFLDAMCRVLRSRCMLLVLDNCEHLVDAAAAVAHAMLAACPNVVVLATSREVLGVSGETVRRVAGLSVPAADAVLAHDVTRSEAVTLFTRRATESAPAFALTDANAAAVSRICRQLDGIPLALELAGARMRLLGAHQLAERLDRLDLLSEGPRTADPRHRTLTATIGWSHDLLPEPERIVLRRLAVFPGTWTLAAAEAVAAKGTDGLDGPQTGDILGIVGRLVDKSLVLPVPPADAWAEREEPRYRFLETIRQFGALRLEEAGEHHAVLLRLRDHLQGLVTLDWPEAQLDAWRARRLHAEIDSIRAVLQWCLARGDDAGILALSAPLAWIWEHSAPA